MYLIVKELSQVNYAVREIITKAKEIAGIDEPLTVVDTDTAIEQGITGVGLGVKGFGVNALSPAQLTSKGMSLSMLVQHLTVAKTEPEHFEFMWGKNLFLHGNSDAEHTRQYRGEDFRGVVALDIETAGNLRTDPFATNEILSVAAYNGDYALVFTEESNEVRDILKDICEHANVVCHNGTFDMPYLSARYGISLKHTNDTLLMDYVLFNTSQEHGLKPLAKRWFGADDWDEANKQYTKGGAHFENIPRQQLYLYNAYDVYWTYRLYFALFALLEAKPEVRAYYEYRMRLSSMLQDVQLNGVPVDVKVLDELEDLYTKQRDTALSTLVTLAGDGGFNPASPKQLKEYFASKGYAVSSLDKAAIKGLERAGVELEFLSALKEFRKASKVIGSYIKTIRGFVGSDGKIHPYYLPDGAKTGRLSAKNPAIQTMGRDSGIKRALIAPEGYKIISCDYSQAELRTVAELSNDNNMMAAFQPGAPDFFDNLMTKIYPEEFPTIEAYEAFDKAHHTEAKNKRALIKGIVYGCVPTHVLIRTYEGDKAWWELQEGERIPITGCATGEATVTHINHHFDAPVYRYKLGEHYVITTQNHRWPLKDGSFVEAKDLRAGHELLTMWEGQTITLEARPDFDYLGRCDVWCPTTTSGTWVAVDNDRLFLTGNSNYGRGAQAIAIALEKPVEDAQHVLNSYYENYPNLKRWQDAVRQSVGDDSQSWRTTTPFGMSFKQEVVTYKNRHKVENEALAFVPQSTANDICLHAALEINKRVGQYGAQLIGLVHDATYVLCPQDTVAQCAQMMETEMAGAARRVFHRVPFVAEAEIGQNWEEV